jgi:N,N-dimethylformamidase
VKIVGYANRLSVQPREDIEFKVSCDAPDYRARLVRLVHGDDSPRGPGFREELVESTFDGEYRGRRQQLPLGSSVVVPDAPRLDLAGGFTVQMWVWPTLPGGGRQALLERGGDGLFLDERGSLELRAGGDAAHTDLVLRNRTWYFVAGVYDRDRREIRLAARPVESWAVTGADESSVHRIAGGGTGGDGGELQIGAGYNGKIDSPRLFSRALATEELELLRSGRDPLELDSVAAAWDFSRGIRGRSVEDVSPNELHGRTVNLPARGMTGWNWRGVETSYALAPEQYGAIHFHDDDLDDAGWDTDFTFMVPPDLPSGVYAAHTEADGEEDYIPFFVRPPTGRPTARVALILPTFSYLAYGNEHLLTQPENQAIFEALGSVSEYPVQAQDRYIVEQQLSSIYDVHRDGSGVCYSSRLRPIVNMRPKYNFTLLAAGRGSPHQLNADLHLVDWLHEKGFEFDVLTDEDLHAEGGDLLSPYTCVVSGTHHEYWSREMLEGLRGYVDGGGRFMYLTGNGLYWVTGFDAEEGHTIEVRRCGPATRTWDAEPGEWFLTTTGELGGLWRAFGRAPQRLVGVGFTAEGLARGQGYRRQPASNDPRAAFIFEGVGGDETIGACESLVNEWGAAGYEIDRADEALGTPPHALVVATATGYSDVYQHVVDELLGSDSRQGGSVEPRVRSDMVFFECPNGGAVFSVGSIAWCGCLSYNGYYNSVSRITENVLRRFTDDEPFAPPPVEAGSEGHV